MLTDVIFSIEIQNKKYYGDSFQHSSYVGTVSLINNGIVRSDLSVFELNSISITLEIPNEYGDVHLTLGSRSIHFEQIKTVNQKLTYFASLDNPFLNQLGYVNFYLSFSAISDFICEVPLEVKSTKATFDDAKDMLAFIQKKDSSIVNLCFSQSRLNSGYKDVGMGDAQSKMILGNKIINFIIKKSLEFRHNPILGKKIESEIVRYNSRKHHIDNRSIEWLGRHTEQLEISIDEQDLIIGEIPYNLRDIKITKATANLDVFENRVIHSFLIIHRNYLTKIQEMTADKAYHQFDDFQFSFKELLDDWISENTRPHQLIEYGLSNISKVKTFLDKYIPCKLNKIYLPRLTPNVKKHNHYLELFKMIHEYYKMGEPDWSENSVINGLKNLAKIYELYVLLSLVKGFEENGYQFDNASFLNYDSVSYAVLPEGFANNVYFAKHITTRKNITLYYEPTIYEQSDRRSKKHTDLYKAINSLYVDNSIIKDTWNKLKPDFIISTGDVFIILDAKYSDISTVRKYYLTPLMIKYGYGIMRDLGSHKSLSQGVIAVCAKGDQYYNNIFFEPTNNEPLSMTGIIKHSTRENISEHPMFKRIIDFLLRN